MHTFKLIIAYDGSNYSGWQIQKNSISIQTLIEDALSIVLRQKILIVGSGRTDAGVHALGQVAHFTVHEDILPLKILFALNGILPKDIRILSLEKVPLEFHARYSATGKIYHYHIHCSHAGDPFSYPYTTHIPIPLDVGLLRNAASIFVGTHNFSSFAHEASRGSAARNPIRTLRRLDVIEEPPKIRLEFEGDGFLYKMVRNIVGILIEVSTGQRSLEALPEIFAACDRKKAGKTAPPMGLFLIKVLYCTDASDAKCTISEGNCDS